MGDSFRDSPLGQEVIASNRSLLEKAIEHGKQITWYCHELAFDELIDAAKNRQIVLAYTPKSSRVGTGIETAAWYKDSNFSSTERWNHAPASSPGGFHGQFAWPKSIAEDLDKSVNGSYLVPLDKIDRWYELVKQEADSKDIVAFLGEENRMPDAPPRPLLFQKLLSYVT